MTTMSSVILLSGGMDSATVLAVATERGDECFTMSFDYGQRHRAELVAADRFARSMGVREHRVLRIDLGALGGSALTDPGIEVPHGPTEGIPATYVPARNTVFLALGLAWAEVLNASRIYVGVNAVDYSGYPDCRPEFIEAFQKLANLATRNAVEGQPIEIVTPLIDLSKQEIIELGSSLGVDYAQTVSCYSADEAGRACGRCDACRLRSAGFEAAGLADPTRYQSLA